MAMIQTIQPEISRRDIILYNDIVYATRMEDWSTACIPLKLHLMRESPESSEKKKFPLILWLNGGGWRCVSPFRYIMNFDYLLQAGFAVASVQYRVSSQATFPEPLVDVKAAIRFLRAHANFFGIDKNHIGIMGESAGGHLAAMAGVTPNCAEFSSSDWSEESDAVNAAICWYTPFDLAMINEAMPSEGSPPRLLLGNPKEGIEAQAKKASPISYVCGKEPPFLLLHGTKDDVVSIRQSHSMYEALSSQGDLVEFYRLEGAGHCAVELVQPQIQNIILDFCKKHI